MQEDGYRTPLKPTIDMPTLKPTKDIPELTFWHTYFPDFDF
jgi:hypothetical protein